MNKLTIPAQSLPLDDSWDVIVLGGGPAGCAAATAAACSGSKTLLIERTGSLGGMGTQGLVTTWAPFSDGQGNIIYGGLAEKLLHQTKAAMPHIPKDKLDWVIFNPEQLKRLYDDMVTAAGASIIFDTFFCDTVTDDDGTITAVIVAAKSGMRVLSGKVYIDCTGDGDVAASAGGEFHKGDDESDDLQPGSLCFLLGNVNTDAYKAGPILHPQNPDSPIYQIAKSCDYPNIKDTHCCSGMLMPGVVTFNAGHVWDVDATDEVSTTKALIEGRKIACEFRDALAKHYPDAFGQCEVLATAPSMGIRETRRIVGDYTLTVDDYFARQSFPDEIGRNNYWIDIHTAADEIAESAESHDHVVHRYEHYKTGESHGIPYRCLTPQGLNNVLVAGRCISCDRLVMGSVRVMPACLVTGEAAGAAATLAIQANDNNIHNVDTNELRKQLKQHGAFLPEQA